jgi:hypothetical protein
LAATSNDHGDLIHETHSAAADDCGGDGGHRAVPPTRARPSSAERKPE